MSGSHGNTAFSNGQTTIVPPPPPSLFSRPCPPRYGCHHPDRIYCCLHTHTHKRPPERILTMPSTGRSDAPRALSDAPDLHRTLPGRQAGGSGRYPLNMPQAFLDNLTGRPWPPSPNLAQIAASESQPRAEDEAALPHKAQRDQRLCGDAGVEEGRLGG